MNRYRIVPYIAALLQLWKWAALYALAFVQQTLMPSETMGLLSFFSFSAPQVMVILALIWLGLRGEAGASLRLPLSISLYFSFFLCAVYAVVLGGQDLSAFMLSGEFVSLGASLLLDSLTLILILYLGGGQNHDSGLRLENSTSEEPILPVEDV